MSHARLSPSAATRWMFCPGSVRLTEHLPSPSSKYSREGSSAHELAELCLSTGFDAKEFIGHPITIEDDVFIVDEAMVDAVQIYLDVVRSHPGELFVEVALDLSDLLGEPAWGTSDAVVYDVDARKLSVIDLKYGKGVAVDAWANPQLMLYALGAYAQVKGQGPVETVEMIIVQPRIDHVDSYSMTVAELLEFGARASQAAAVTRQADAPLAPDEKACRWCQAKGSCPALADHVATTLPIPVDSFADLTQPEHGHLPSPDLLVNDVIARILPLEDTIRDWLDAVRAEATRRMFAGEFLPGHKLVGGKRGPRQWDKAHADEVEAILRRAMRYNLDQVCDRKLKTPTQIEKLLADNPGRWQRLQPYITQSDGKPAVVPITDKREALSLGVCPGDFPELAQSE